MIDYKAQVDYSVSMRKYLNEAPPALREYNRLLREAQLAENTRKPTSAVTGLVHQAIELLENVSLHEQVTYLDREFNPEEDYCLETVPRIKSSKSQYAEPQDFRVDRRKLKVAMIRAWLSSTSIVSSPPVPTAEPSRVDMFALVKKVFPGRLH